MATHRPSSFYYRSLVTLAVAFLTVGVASARAGYLTAEQYPAPLSGTQLSEPTIYTVGGTFRCSSSSYSGSLPYSSSTFSLKPTFSNCTLGGLSVSVSPEGCSFEYYIGSSIGGGGFNVTWSSSMYIRCPKGQSIKISSPPFFGCAMEIKPQGSLDPVYIRGLRQQDYWLSTYPNYPYLDHVTPGDIQIEHDISNLSYVVTQDSSPFCSFSGTGTFSLADYESRHTVVAGNARGYLRIN